jgi:hypothetical protein
VRRRVGAMTQMEFIVLGARGPSLLVRPQNYDDFRTFDWLPIGGLDILDK